MNKINLIRILAYFWAFAMVFFGFTSVKLYLDNGWDAAKISLLFFFISVIFGALRFKQIKKIKSENQAN